MEKKRKKKMGKWVGILLLIAAVYLILGATVPFARYKKVTEETKEAFDAGDYYSNTISCDRAMLLETNVSAWEERIRLLSMAKESIILSTFDMRAGESTKDILAVLLAKAEEGVSVKILVDGISGLLRMEGEELFYAASAHPNIEIKLYNRINVLKPWTLQGRMHDKYVIVDDLAFLLGGRNTFDYFIGDFGNKNASLDREVLIYNTAHGTAKRESALFTLKEYFEEIWSLDLCTYFHEKEALLEKTAVKEQTKALKERYEALRAAHAELFEAYDYTAHTYETGAVRLISNPTHSLGKEPVVFYTLAKLMQQAEEVVLHTPYAVCNSYMYEELKLTAETVPEFHIMLNSIENGDNFMASSDYLRNKKKLLQTGAAVYEYDGGISYHAKSLVLDKELAIVGSYNLDLRSSYLDTELMLSVQSKGLAAELLKEMETLETDCRRVIDLHTYEVPEHVTVAKLPFWKKVALRVVGFALQPFRYLL